VLVKSPEGNATLLKAGVESRDKILRGVVVAMATRILFTRERAFDVLALVYSKGSRRVGRFHGTDLGGETTKIARVKGHGNLSIEIRKIHLIEKKSLKVSVDRGKPLRTVVPIRDSILALQTLKKRAGGS
jgi:hypothetical protein